MKLQDMHISDKGIKLGEDAEGIRYTPYDDGCGNMTIGIGHLIKAGESFPNKLTKQEAYEIYKKDLLSAEFRVKKAVLVDVTQSQFDVLVDMAFNMKYFSFMNSSVVRFVNEGKSDQAAERLLRYNKAFSEKKKTYIEMPGLVKRCKARYDLWKSID
jgi:lysozyme